MKWYLVAVVGILWMGFLTLLIGVPEFQSLQTHLRSEEALVHYLRHADENYFQLQDRLAELEMAQRKEALMIHQANWFLMEHDDLMHRIEALERR